MKRSWFGAGLLALVLLASLLVTWGMDRCHQPIVRDLEQAADAAMAEDWERTGALIRRAGERWEKYWKFTAAVADHEPMEKIDSLFAQLEVYQAAEDREAAAAVCAELAGQVGDIHQAHQLKWWNFL